MSERRSDEDVALLLGSTPDAERVAVLRKRGERVEAAVLARAEEGKPIHGDLVRLTPRDEPRLFDVETLHEAPRRDGGGPAQVSSASYRDGWDRVFAKKRRVRRPAELAN